MTNRPCTSNHRHCIETTLNSQKIAAQSYPTPPTGGPPNAETRDKLTPQSRSFHKKNFKTTGIEFQLHQDQENSEIFATVSFLNHEDCTKKIPKSRKSRQTDFAMAELGKHVSTTIKNVNNHARIMEIAQKPFPMKII